MKNGEVKTVTEKRVHYKYPSINGPRHEHLMKWISDAQPDILRAPILSQYRDYMNSCKADNIRPFCYNVFARAVTKI